MTTVRVPIAAAAALILVAVGACGSKDVSYEASEAGLKKLGEDMMAAVKAGDDAKRDAIAQSLLLPDHQAWFVEHFGEQAGNRMAAEYTPMAGQIGMVWQFFKAQVERGRTEIVAATHARPDHDAATGLQQAVMKAAKEPVTLYTLRFTEPGNERGSSLWSFVHDGKTFRFAGKMRKVRDTESTKVLDRAYDELPVRDFKQSMKKGLGK